MRNALFDSYLSKSRGSRFRSIKQDRAIFINDPAFSSLYFHPIKEGNKRNFHGEEEGDEKGPFLVGQHD